MSVNDVTEAGIVHVLDLAAATPYSPELRQQPAPVQAMPGSAVDRAQGLIYRRLGAWSAHRRQSAYSLQPCAADGAA
ncbi:MAG: hypothetical protein CL607_09075 [Anaerolineaceae bacterium]|nr:hypothetical protein [Anaerolineaceae bacterium]